MQRIWVLNDLFVRQDKRRLGCAPALLQAAVNFGRQEGGYRVRLETEPDNIPAQRLYERNGWKRLPDIQYCFDL